MGLNFKSFRIKEVKNRLRDINEKTSMPFTKQLSLLHELLSIQTISLRNCRYARKYVCEKMRPLYLDQGSIDVMNKLEERFAAAELRRTRRREKKLALKAGGAVAGTPSKRGRKSTPPQPPVAPGPSPMALWQEMLDRQKEKGRGTQG